MAKSAPRKKEPAPRNGHINAARDLIPAGTTSATLTPSSQVAATGIPLDVRSMWNSIIDLARQAGQHDLVEEFRCRSTELLPADGKQSIPNNTVPVAADTNGPAKPAILSPQAIQKSILLARVALDHLRAGRLAEAMEIYQQVVALDPNNHDAHANIGYALATMGKRPEAVIAYQQALRLRPDNPVLHDNLGILLSDLNQFAQAEKAFREAIRLAPNEALYHRRLGRVLDGLGQMAEAEAAFRQAITLKPKEPEFHTCLGTFLMRASRFAEAEAEYRQSTTFQPDKAEHWVNLGKSLETQRQSAAAESVLRLAVALAPTDPEIHNLLGIVHGSQNHHTDAEASYRKAIELNPNMATAHNNLGNNLRHQDRFDEAIVSISESIRLAPKYTEAHNNLGIVYMQRRQFADGQACYDEAIRLRPDYPEAHLNRSLLWLGQGDFARGWAEYEWRLRMQGRKPPSGPGERWDGSPLNGRTLVLLAEQGLGDVVQFMRYAAVIPRGSGGTVILECPEGLMDLAKTCRGVDKIVPRGQIPPDCDLFILLLSVPYLLNTKLETIPAEIPYLFADPERVAYWEDKMAPLPGCRVGITWQGSLAHRGDRLRSVPLAHFKKLADVRGVTLCSVQKAAGVEQLFNGTAGEIWLYDLGGVTQPSYADTAAVFHTLDLVVTIDSSVAHVAGALGVPVWILIPYSSDFCWLQERDDSPWYPTVRLFRQPKRGDWDSVFSEVAEALEQWPDRLRGFLKFKGLSVSSNGTKK